jgi:hypothetical protein
MLFVAISFSHIRLASVHYQLSDNETDKQRSGDVNETNFAFQQSTPLHNKELHDLYSSPSTIRIIKLRRMRWAGHVARMGRRGTLIDYWWENQREKDH